MLESEAGDRGEHLEPESDAKLRRRLLVVNDCTGKTHRTAFRCQVLAQALASPQPRQVCEGRPSPMGKHFTAAELDQMHALRANGSTVLEVHARLAAGRRRSRRLGPSVTAVRRAIKGESFKRAARETRGRPRILSTTNLRTAERVRKQLIAKADGEAEVHWDDIIRKSRIPRVHRTTLAKNMNAAGFGIGWRQPRLKPTRGEPDEAERKELCNKMRRLPLRFWLQEVDAFIDCKQWRMPLTVRGKSHAKRLRVRGHLRKKSEGLKKGFTKPDKSKHRQNTGGSAHLCAAIIGGRVRVWHYLPRTWNGATAAALYKNVLAPALKKYRGAKRRYLVLEDNDPTGFKSNIAVAAKQDAGIETLQFPRRSPDLNPCDFSLWEEIENRLAAQAAPRQEPAQGFKARLRKTAMSIPEPVVRKMVQAIKGRAQSIYDHNGGHIPRD